MSCQGQGYAWEVICVLCSTVAQSDSRSVVLNDCALLAEDFPQPSCPDEPQFCASSCLALAPQGLQATNRWLNICALPESRGLLGKWCSTSQSFVWDKRQAHFQRCQVLTFINNLQQFCFCDVLQISWELMIFKISFIHQLFWECTGSS